MSDPLKIPIVASFHYKRVTPVDIAATATSPDTSKSGQTAKHISKWDSSFQPQVPIFL
jgi:hypothetical protein